MENSVHHQLVKILCLCLGKTFYPLTFFSLDPSFYYWAWECQAEVSPRLLWDQHQRQKDIIAMQLIGAIFTLHFQSVVAKELVRDTDNFSPWPKIRVHGATRHVWGATGGHSTSFSCLSPEKGGQEKPLQSLWEVKGCPGPCRWP